MLRLESDDDIDVKKKRGSTYDLNQSMDVDGIEDVEIAEDMDTIRSPLTKNRNYDQYGGDNKSTNKTKTISTMGTEMTYNPEPAESFLSRVYAKSKLVSKALTITYAESTFMEIEEKLHQNEVDDPNRIKFGWLDGVMARCILNIFGVIMFLRVGFMVGQAGIIQSIAIILISSIVTVFTTLSMSAICTNGKPGGGGAYYFISRALGPSIGGAIGIVFTIGNMMAVSLYLIGFAETLRQNLEDELSGWTITNYDHSFGSEQWDIRIWSNVILIGVLILAIFGLNYVVKTQLMLLFFIMIALILYFVGSFYKTYDDFNEDQQETQQMVYGIHGWTNGNFKTNLDPDYDDDMNFWMVFAIFFPAVTGIMAGANISGDLKDPGVDIPKGTLWAIGVSSIIYILLATVTGAVVARYELDNNYLIMASICVWDYLILIGVYAATLSSAIASLVGAPRILQAIAFDLSKDCFNGIQYFAKQNKSGDPIRGYFLTFIVAFLCNLIGDLNAVAPLISQFFMLTYLIINFSCLYLEIPPKSDKWDPSFTYFSKYTAFLGTIGCAYVMFVMSWIYALLALVPTILIFFYVEYRNPKVIFIVTKSLELWCCKKQNVPKNVDDILNNKSTTNNDKEKAFLNGGNPTVHNDEGT